MNYFAERITKKRALELVNDPNSWDIVQETASLQLAVMTFGSLSYCRIMTNGVVNAIEVILHKADKEYGFRPMFGYYTYDPVHDAIGEQMSAKNVADEIWKEGNK